MNKSVQNKYSNMRRWVILLCILSLAVFHNSVFGQNLSATLKADSNTILIGDYLQVKLTIKHSRNLSLAIPNPSDTLGNMAVVSVSKIDTATTGNDVVLTRSYTVSAYDSGNYHAGPVLFFFKNSSGGMDSLTSNAVPIRVNTLDVDTTKPFKPIKGPLEVPYTWREFMYYIIAFVVLLLLLVLFIWWWRMRKNKQPETTERPKPKDPAHVWARKELRKLEEEKLWQKEEVKLYYSKMTDILRLYLYFRYDWSAMESTTEEIQSQIQLYPINDVAKKLLLDVLRNADLVKFAKRLPMPDMNMKTLEEAYNFIDVTAPTENKPEIKKEDMK